MTTIVPFDKTTITTITSFTIDITDIVLFTSVRMRINLFDESGRRVDCTFLTMEGEDYVGWGNDDQYIINFACRQMGFVLSTVVEPVPTVADAPVVDAPVVDAPVVDAPVVDAPVADAPVADAPVADAP
jgi:hypothetical protein